MSAVEPGAGETESWPYGRAPESSSEQPSCGRGEEGEPVGVLGQGAGVDGLVRRGEPRQRLVDQFLAVPGGHRGERVPDVSDMPPLVQHDPADRLPDRRMRTRQAEVLVVLA